MPISGYSYITINYNNLLQVRIILPNDEVVVYCRFKLKNRKSTQNRIQNILQVEAKNRKNEQKIIHKF